MLVLEKNLLWSSKLKQGLTILGHEAKVSSGEIPDEPFDLASVNLSQAEPDPAELVNRLRDKRIMTIAHAGHKEKQLLELGKRAGADLLVTNGELSAKLPEVLSKALADRHVD